MADDKLNQLIEALYETVLNPGHWQEAIKLCVQYLDGIDSQMLTLDKNENKPIFSVTAIDQDLGDEYSSHYMALDPRLQIISGNVGEWQSCHHFLDRKFVSHNEFYQDFFVPNGGRYTLGATVDDNQRHCTVIGFYRAVNQSPFDNNHIQAAQRFGGHLQRVLRLQAQTQQLQAKAEFGAMAIDALALGMLIVDADGSIRHLNQEAERLLATNVSGLSGKMGKLSASDPFNKSRLAALIAEATAYPAVGGAMFLRGNANKQVFVTPLPAASPFVRDWQMPLALVLVTDVGKALSPLELVGKLYDLAPAELRVASALLEGKSPEDYAREAGVTMNTVRTQLKHLFGKTGTHRQSELVALLSRVPPLRS